MYYDEYGNEKKFTKNDTIAIRYFNGSFVIFSKGSYYNADPGAYNARHNKMSSDNFREYINKQIR